MRELERQLWAAADKLRGNISSSDYKYVVLGLIFLKYVSDAFSARYQAAVDDNYDPEDRDWYLAENVFWIPKEARWEHLVASAKQPEIGVLVIVPWRQLNATTRVSRVCCQKIMPVKLWINAAWASSSIYLQILNLILPVPKICLVKSTNILWVCLLTVRVSMVANSTRRAPS